MGFVGVVLALWDFAGVEGVRYMRYSVLLLFVLICSVCFRWESSVVLFCFGYFACFWLFFVGVMWGFCCWFFSSFFFFFLLFFLLFFCFFLGGGFRGYCWFFLGGWWFVVA